VRQGFLNPCRLWYLAHPLDPLPSPGPDAPAFTLLPFPQVRQRFEATLPATYAGSLDFPELAGQRTLDDILEGHRAGTLHDPDRWWLIEHRGQDVGIAMVGLLSDSGEWDLSYLGLVPTARGRALGRAVLEEILYRAYLIGIPRVLVAVDERNVPAWRLYRSLGFLPDEAREVFLKLPAPSADTPLPPHAPVL
jgi:GNAT superfamily N-acetyltransferase